MSGPRTALAVGAVLAAPLDARAYRPFNSTDAAVAEKGQVEIELGPFGLVQEGSDRWLVAPSVILNWGFADRWELVLEGRHFVHLGAAVADQKSARQRAPWQHADAFVPAQRHHLPLVPGSAGTEGWPDRRGRNEQRSHVRAGGRPDERSDR